MGSTVALGVTLAISVIIFVSMTLYASGKIAEYRARRKKKKRIEEEETHKITFVTKFHKLLFSVFLSAMVLFIPVHWGEFSGDFYVVRGIKTFLMSILSTAKMFILDIDFEPIHVLFTSEAIRQTGSKLLFNAVRYAYTIYAAALYLFAPLLTAGFVLSLFKGVTEYIRYQYVCRADEVYLISELNERSIELAKDILSEDRIAKEDEKERAETKQDEGKRGKFSANRKRVVVFAEVFDKSEERSFELISQAQALGAFCFKRDIVDIGLKRRRINEYTKQKLYFIGENEDENVEQALLMIEGCRKDARFNTQNTHFYVFSTTAESEVLIDSVDNGDMIVRRINENKNLVYATLRDPAIAAKISDDENDFIFKHAVLENGVYKIRVLIVGLGNYGMELLKALCWSCQFVNYELEVYVFDKEQNARDRIARFAPGLIANNGNRASGVPYYKIFFGSEQIIKDENGERAVDNGIDVRTRGFFQRLDTIVTGPISAAFVTLGEDELNIETAMGLRSYFGQKSQQVGLPVSYKKSPKIYPVVYSPAKNRICSKNGGLESYGHRSYGITFIGNMEKRYSLEAIEQNELVQKGEEVHLRYGGKTDLVKVNAFVDALNKSKEAQDARRMEKFIAEKVLLIDNQIAKWDSDLGQFEERLRKNKKLFEKEKFSKDVLEAKLASVKQSLKYTPSDEWLAEERDDYEMHIRMLDERKKNEIARVDMRNKLSLYAASKNKQYLLDCLAERLVEAAERVAYLEQGIKDSAREYYRYEYLRNSSMATATHEDIVEAVKAMCERRGDLEILGKWIDVQGTYEHMRWMVYMWSEGYLRGKFKSAIAKTHTRLVSVEERTWADQLKTEGIIGFSKTTMKDEQ